MQLENEPLDERLLYAWIRTTTILNSDRIASELPLNEAIICNILYRNERNFPGSYLTATDLCSETKMRKSQMNRTLRSMESRSLIKRERSRTDRRSIYIIPLTDHNEIYSRQHIRILKIVNNIIDHIGSGYAEELTSSLLKICDLTEDFTKEQMQ